MRPTTVITMRHKEIGRRVRQLGGDYGVRIAMESDRQDVPVSVILAICEQESEFTNVFGHDRKANGKPSGIPARWMGTEVTKTKYRWYKLGRRLRGSQGVGPMQLTFPGYQDEADRDGGCHKTDVNIATAVGILRKLFDGCGSWAAVYSTWNAGSVNSQGMQYAAEVVAKQRKWHRNLT